MTGDVAKGMGEISSLKPCCVCRSAAEVAVEYRLQNFQVLRCGRCGLHYVNEVFAQLPGDGIPEGHEQVGRLHSDYFRKRFRKNLARIEKLIPKGRILDVGCHHGYFLAAARDDGWDTAGIDLDGYAIKIAREQGIDAQHGVFEESDYPPESFDVTTMFYTIEHQSDPAGAVARAHEALRPGGLLVVETPTDDFLVGKVASVLSRLTGGRFAAPLSYLYGSSASSGHVYRFSASTLARLLESVGFRVIDVRPADNPSFGLYLAKRNYGRGQLRRLVNSMVFGTVFLMVNVLRLHSRMSMMAVKSMGDPAI
ncbi:MAG: class I SAM-dependent methyltransferase [Actinobacteria bacterium]|nr:class I SAM-dependent methyltransferase [Actinomycetota bacterium]